MTNYSEVDVWVFDINRRVYRTGSTGRSVGGPIWREHWVKKTIVGETKRSWVMASGNKIPKAGGPNICFNEDEINRRALVEMNRYRIADAIYRITDWDVLEKVAKVIGCQVVETQP